MDLVEKIVKIFKNTNYFCNNISLRCLTGFKYTSKEYLLWKYSEVLLAVVTGSKVLISVKQDSTRENI